MRSLPSRFASTNSGNVSPRRESEANPSSIDGMSMAPPDRVTLASGSGDVAISTSLLLVLSSSEYASTFPNNCFLLGRCQFLPLTPEISIPRARLLTQSQKKLASAWSLRFWPCSAFLRELFLLLLLLPPPRPRPLELVPADEPRPPPPRPPPRPPLVLPADGDRAVLLLRPFALRSFPSKSRTSPSSSGEAASTRIMAFCLSVQHAKGCC
mmetsp:Transcript_15081/g.32724  ORF Transcript_15081/g.32724 Transcript_15081/m.32724 type:complete len:211 (-) Transcript_15081:29-661(-)